MSSSSLIVTSPGDPAQVTPRLSRTLIILVLVLVVAFTAMGVMSIYMGGEWGPYGQMANTVFNGAALFTLFYYLM